MNKIEINLEQARREYGSADENTKAVLSRLFGEENLKSNIMGRVKSYEDACRELGISPVLNHDLEIYDRETDTDEGDLPRNVIAMMKLEIIVKALNEGWVPPFDGETGNYWPWLWYYTKEEVAKMSEENKKKLGITPIPSGVLFGGFALYGAACGFAYARSYYAPSYSAANIGSRLCLKSEELAIYCGKQFIDLWLEYYLA